MFLRSTLFEYQSLQPWLRSAVVIFALGFLGGMLAYGYAPWILAPLSAALAEKFGITPDLDFRLALKLFWNNITAAAIGLFGGVALGLPSGFILALNGLLLGYISAALFSTLPFDVWRKIGFLAAGLLPHGILEVPALLLASAAGLRLGLRWWVTRRPTTSRRRIFFSDFKSAVYVLAVALALLFCAALIEVFLTGRLLEWYMPG